MPPDIRSFFGGGSQGSSSSKQPPASRKTEDPSSSRRRRSRKVVVDSDDDEEVVEKKPPAKAKAPPKKKEKPEEPAEEVTTSEYFGSSKKRAPPKRKTQETAKPEKPQESPAKSTRSSRRAPIVVDDEEDKGDDDILAAAKTGRDDDYVEESDMDLDDEFDPAPEKKPTSTAKKAAPTPKASKAKKDEEYVDEDELDSDDIAFEEPTPRQTRTTRGRGTAGDVKVPQRESLKRKPEDEVEEPKAKKPARAPKAQPTPRKPAASKKAPSKETEAGNTERQEVLDSIPTIRPPTPPTETKKFNPYAPAPQRDPPSAGSRELPTGAENCLAGLSFVFTGVLNTLGREEGQSLVKRYGGKVTGAPSSKTSFVVLGADAGPKKLQTIEKFKLKTIDEDGLYELIRKMPANGGSGKAGEDYAAKKKAEEERVRKMAEEIDREERRRREEAKQSETAAQAAKPTRVQGPHAATSRTPSAQAPASGAATPGRVDDRLWTVKYAPTSLGMICGNKAPVERLQNWLHNWRNNAKAGFKKPGRDGSGIYRSVMLHGPPGIGKTTAAHLVAKIEGYDIVESNASDTRSKKLVEEGLRGVLDTTSLGGYFAGAGKNVQATKKNLVLIMDEVDGMSAGDRGGVGALAAVARKTNVPMILICNERSLPKMRPFDRSVFEIPFRRPSADQIRARLMTICFREGLKVSPQVLDALVEGTRSDIRQLVNMLSTAKLDQQSLDYNSGKDMTKAWEKHVILKPWDIVGKILSSQMFAPSSNASLNEKIELYFNDHEFSYLMLQENYIKTSPALASKYMGPERKFKLLELMDNAAESISDGDLVDRQIHGSQQQWSLMPTHAAFSFVRPASFVYGNMTERATFTSWLGNNSKQGKLSREVKEIQGHMRLRASADRHEIRQQYLPTLWTMLVKRLQTEGKEAARDVIRLMDTYYLTREDFDAMIELGLGPMDEKNVNIDTQTKSTFTRLYNQMSHPIPFMKASAVVAPKNAPKEKPDIEEAIDESDEGEPALDEAEVKEDEDELDLKKDKFVKVPKKKAPAKPRAKKAKKADDDEDEEEEEKPKKRTRKPKAKA